MKCRVLALLFAGAVLCFFFPFATVSCGEDEVRFTGVQLAFYSVPPAASDPAAAGAGDLAQQVEDEGSFFALVAFLLAAGGFSAALLVPRWPIWQALLALGSLLALGWDRLIAARPSGVDTHWGFHGAVSLLAAAFVLNLRRRIPESVPRPRGPLRPIKRHD